MTDRARKKNEWPIEVKTGSAVVKIYCTTKEGGYKSFAVSYYAQEQRKVRFFQDLTAAKKEAKKIADNLANGEHVALTLTGHQKLAVERALEILAPYGVTIDAVAREYADARQALQGFGCSLVEAARDYARRHRGVVAGKMLPEAVNELIEQITAEKNNTNNGTRRKDAWLKLLRTHLQRKLAVDFNDKVTNLTSATLEPWLVGLTCSERTRRNVRDCVAYFIRWAKGRNYLPKDADPLANVQNFRKRKLGLVETITPEELSKLLRQCPEDFVPYLALRAFAGLRDSEARRLEWQHVDLRAKWIDIPEHIAKQSDDDEGVRRMVKIRPVLAAWLRPHCKKSGRVCPYDNSVKKLLELTRDSEVKMPRNALRHTFISAAVTLSKDLNAVAMEAGNSVPVIKQHYWRRMRPNLARSWFQVMPGKAPSNVVSVDTSMGSALSA